MTQSSTSEMVPTAVLVYNVALKVQRAYGISKERKYEALRAALRTCGVNPDEHPLPLIEESELERACRRLSLCSRQYLLAIGVWVANADLIETSEEQLVLCRLRQMLDIPAESARKILQFVRAARLSALLDPTPSELQAILKAMEYFVSESQETEKKKHAS